MMPPRRWEVAALAAIKELAETKSTFTSDDLYDLVPEPPHHNMVGDAFRTAQAMKYIEHTGEWPRSRRPSSKGRSIREWRKAGSTAKSSPPQGVLL